MRVSALSSTIVLLLWTSVGWAQPISPEAGTTYRVFLISGEPLPSYGEPVVIGDRVIFNLLLGPEGATEQMQLVSLPIADVDSDRTARYAHAMRAAHYGATRGEADYGAVTAEVARVLDQLTVIADPQRRLALAEAARRQLLAWPDQHYQYRADEIRELAVLFDAVIAELRIAAGEPGVVFDLVARSAPLESLLPPPTLRETVALALTAARLADVGTERVGILRKATETASRLDDDAVRATVSMVLDEEVEATSAYHALLTTMGARVESARRRADVAALERLALELDREDTRLGQRRPADVREFRSQLVSALASSREYRAALDTYTRQIAGLRRYADRLRPLLDRFDEFEPVITALRERRGLTPTQLSVSDADLLRLGRDLDLVRPPLAQAAVHSTFQSVLRMAREAMVRRRQARSSQAAEMFEASAAASGALLLAGQVRRDLDATLRRPSIQ